MEGVWVLSRDLAEAGKVVGVGAAETVAVGLLGALRWVGGKTS